MAFRRSPVRSRSGPPSFARPSGELRMASQRATFHQRRMSTIAALRQFEPRRWTDTTLASRRAAVQHSHTCSTRRGAEPAIPFAHRRELQQDCAARKLRRGRFVSDAKRCVYVLRSRADPSRYCTGVTSDLSTRLEAHNSGRCAHTSPNAPWEVDVFVQFADEHRALAFERYLKSGSGHAFATRHLR